MKIAITIAGSDSIGGAGIQADLKAFASLGIYGCSAITCLTAQNTSKIRKIVPVSAEMLREQLEAILEDVNPGAVKTGAIYTAENGEVIANIFGNRTIPLVIDPVLRATTGASLAKEELIVVLKRKLIPLCTLVTPNKSEAEALTGVRISGSEQAEKAAEQLISKGASGVLIKGIDNGEDISDYLSMADGTTRIFSTPRIEGLFHGTGCILSALIAGHISLGREVLSSVMKARESLLLGIERGQAIGKGIRVIEPLEVILVEAQKSQILDMLTVIRGNIEKAIDVRLLPEVGSNLGYSISSPARETDVAGYTGRIVREGGRPRVIGCPQFGASKHIARIILAAGKHNPNIRSAMNIKFNDRNLAACEKAGLSIAFFSRDDEPKEVSSMSWGVDSAIKSFGSVPDAIWDEGGKGKEPMIRILGKDPDDLLEKMIRISKNLQE